MTKRTRLKPALRVLVAAAVLLNFSVVVSRGDNTDVLELSNFSLEELINMQVTSVGKKETRLFRSPAAIAVLTADDLKRLGANSLPEALRAVPGIQVARISANRWAVSARGLNDEYSNKLLVLVDGRSVYTPLFGGVHWNGQDIVLEDLDRIEVIRGPGATLWGANAVNGVINIITKSAKETQGGLVSSTVGTEDQPSISARYGGQLSSNVYYRVYAKYFNREGFEDARGRSMSDDWNVARGGIRLDWEASEQNTLTLLADYFGGTFGETVGKTAIYPVPRTREIDLESDVTSGNILGRWTSKFSEESELKLQVYYDQNRREHPFGGGVLVAQPGEFSPDQNKLEERRDTWDVDLQHRFALGERQDVVWGMGYRRSQDHISSEGTEFFWTRERSADDLYSAFLQDEIAIVPEKLAFTIGSKLEHNDYTGFEVQPAGRIAWTPNDQHTVWGSIARAVRTPTRLERDSRANIAAYPPSADIPLPVIITAYGDRNARSEESLSYELGYRYEPTRRLSFDVSAYFNEYDLLANRADPGQVILDLPPYYLQSFRYHNNIHGHTYGTELLVRWQPTDYWRLTAAYTWWRGDFEGEPYIDVTNPEHQFNVRSSVALGHGLEFNTVGYFVDSVRSLREGDANPIQIDSYFRLDLGLTWAPSERFEFSVWAQNLLDEGHPEFSNYKSRQVAEIPRSFFGKVTWRF
ncbi:MAG TPA: TonB-dependent receptor [Verrucomicrobiae bacterium]|nr:TonB-dependent receptor [Verrucomicrobiae bacterium]